MGVAFYTTNEPDQFQKCDCWDGEPCGYCDDGWALVFNQTSFSNANARTVLNLLGEVGIDLEGSWSTDSLPAVQNRIQNAKSLVEQGGYDSAPMSYRGPTKVIRDPSSNLVTIQGGCRVFECGSTTEEILKRLDQIDAVVVRAMSNQSRVVWG